ncbi:MAG TPA: DUF4402 domain-containing protein [Bacteroidales bacterium]|nr:DUF4402 domain-containing protein [Bacteroidales bacterium]HRZ48945.1 DUF4402 domain-containing protein [Bacteroidales bacterium]
MKKGKGVGAPLPFVFIPENHQKAAILMIRYFLSLVFFVAFSTAAWSQVTVSAQAFAVVIEALTAHEVQQINFGRFSPQSSGGQIVLNPDGSRIANGSVMLASGFSTPGVFTVTGAPLVNFTIQLPTGPILLVHQQTNQTLMVDNWTSDPPAINEINIQENGYKQINIGATLVIGSLKENPTGIYKGSFQLTFAYN